MMGKSSCPLFPFLFFPFVILKEDPQLERKMSQSSKGTKPISESIAGILKRLNAPGLQGNNLCHSQSFPVLEELQKGKKAEGKERGK